MVLGVPPKAWTAAGMPLVQVLKAETLETALNTICGRKA